MDLKGLIYNKQFDTEAHHKLLAISDSFMWVEEMLDYIKELRDQIKNPSEDYELKDDEEETTIKKTTKIGGILCPIDG